jgi:flagellar biosynthesis GTPase FlhF
MKKLLIILPALIIVLGLTAGKIIDDKMKSILQQIQLSETDANGMIWSNCANSNFYTPGPKTLKGLAMGERATVVESVAEYVKEYSATQEFMNKYKELRENRKPQPPEKPKTMVEMKEEQRKTFQDAIKNMEETKKQMPADQQGMFDETIKSYKEQLKEIDNPDNPMFSKDVENIYQQGYDQQMTEYNNNLAQWEKDYPDNNPGFLIKNWLTKFLEETKDIDFSAQTAIDQYKRNVFVKQEYERKSYLWKLCFRAGKEATDAGRKFAQKWLGEL